MKKLQSIFAVVLILITAGCAVAPQTPISLKPTFWDASAKKVGIVMTKVPELDITYPGAGCLLCYAAAAGANSTLSNHVKTLSNENLADLKNEVAEQLKARGMDVVVIDQAIDLNDLPKNKSDLPDSSRLDFSSYKNKYGLTHLVVIDVTFIGMQRAYSSYIPTGAPQGTFIGSSYIVNLENNSFEWYLPLNVFKSVADEWDEPPAFPALTNAYYQALATGKDMILEPFKK